jgi:amino acid adenylation domain-containing protein
MKLINRDRKITEIKTVSPLYLSTPEIERCRDNKGAENTFRQICAKGLLQQLVALNIEEKQGEGISISELRKKLRIEDKYDRLFAMLINSLKEINYIELTGKKVVVSKGIKQELENFRLENALSDFSNEHKDYKAHAALLNLCLKSFKEIITGKVAATDVIFPEGSLDNVSGIYKGNYQSDYFNEILAVIVENSIAAGIKKLKEIEKKKIRILEVGAGTGGTSEVLFHKLKAYQDYIEYVYSDVSKSFLLYAEEKYGEVAPYLETAVFNIEQSPAAQNLSPGTFDIVIGANVVHATKDIAASLMHIKVLLKKQGLLLLNEIAKTELFTTLTFGLLDGWWLYEDAELRLEGNPGLSADSWNMVLTEGGFEEVVSYPLEPGLSQQVIVAQSDGRIVLESQVEKTTVKKSNEGQHQPAAQHTNDNIQASIIVYLKRVFSRILKLDVARIDTSSSFESMGVDSIMIGALSKELSKDTGTIPTTVFFEYTNIQELSAYFSEYHPGYFQPQEKAVEVTKEKISRNDTTIKNRLPEREPAKSQNENHTGDIAIIGLSGRYPGARNMDEFWNNLKQGKDCVTPIPRERWDVEAYYDERKGKEGTINSKYGGFIDGVAEFDPIFFNISPREAERMDPQERLFLQTAWEAIEDAGYAAGQLSQKSVRTGVYVGVMYEEYQLFGAAAGANSKVLGGSPASIANRVSFCCDFNGPSMAVDTMCSSSLTAIHLACKDLQLGEADVAVAGGVNISIHPNKYLILSQGTFLSDRGKCESFGSMGQGFIPGEGVGAVILKPLAKAEADGDRIYGVIKGIALNHGGKTNGYTVPNPKAQAAVISKAIKKARVNAGDFSYIEAHGTGTSLGDPIEIAGLSKAFQAGKKQYCSIGSVKSNIGHCESAAGISGLTKVLLQLKNQQLVPSIHSSVLNPNIDFENSPFKVQQQLEDWTVPNNLPRLAGISSFGAGGSNAHIIIEEYRANNKKHYHSSEPAIIVLSAKNKDRLKDQVSNLKQHLELYPELIIHDIAYTLQTGREPMEERLAVLADNPEELKSLLTDYLEGRTDQLFTGNIKKEKPDFLLEGGAGKAYIKYAIEHSENKSLAQLWVKDINIDWSLLYPEAKPGKISLPAYPFAREKYWYDSYASGKNTETEVVQKIQLLKNEKSIWENGQTEQLKSHVVGNEIQVKLLEGGIALVKMEAKASRNMLTYQLVRSLHKTFLALREQKELKVVVLTGYDNIFCMGGAEEGLRDLADNKGKYTDLPFIYKGLLEFDVPVISAIQGHAFGGGLVFGLYADIVLMAAKATYTANFMKYGFTPGMGATYILGEKLGKPLATEMMFTARLFSGEEIKNRGASVIVTTNVLEEALQLARELSTKPKKALELLKQKMAGELLAELHGHVEKEIQMQALTFHTEEVAERMNDHFGKVALQKTALTEANPAAKSATPAKIVLASLAESEVVMNNKAENSTAISLQNLDESANSPVVTSADSVQMNRLMIIKKIKDIVSEVLHIPVLEVEEETAFTEIGLDSISGVEILREINKTYALSFQGSVLYDYPTINELTEKIIEESGWLSNQLQTIAASQKQEEKYIPTVRIVQEIKSAVPGRASIVEKLKEIIGEALHIPIVELDEDTSLADFGLDSISGVEILREINNQYKISLQGPVLYEHPTLNQLANKISEESGSFTELLREAAIQTIEKELPKLKLRKESLALPVSAYDPFDLSPMQQAYWVGESSEFELGGKQAHLTVEVEYTSFEAERLNQAMDQLIRRHEMLRVKFLPNGTQQLQKEIPGFQVKVYDSVHLPEKEQNEQLALSKAELIKKGPEKMSWPLVEMKLFKLGERDVLQCNISLMICDGGSVPVFFKDLFAFYFDQKTVLKSIEVSFRQYIQQLFVNKQSEKYSEAKNYWAKRISSLPLGPELPYSRGKKSAVLTHKEILIDAGTWNTLKEKIKIHRTSPAVLLCTAYTKVLASWSRKPHFSITMMSLGRELNHPDINQVIGNFSKINILELNYTKRNLFTEELKMVQNSIWKDQEHAMYNGVEVLRDLNMHHNMLGKVAVPVTFASAFNLGYNQSSEVKRLSASLQVPQVAMDHQVCEEADGRLLLSFDIDESYFMEGVINDITGAYVGLINQLSKTDWEVEVKDLIPLTQKQLIDLTNDTAAGIPSGFLFEPFDVLTKIQPAAIAVIDGNHQKSYTEIYEYSNKIAHALRAQGVQPNQLVAVIMNKGWEEVPACLGIMKSGAAYLPIDCNMPFSRLEYILGKAEVKQVIVTKELIDKGYQIPQGVAVFEFESAFAQYPVTDLERIQQQSDLAYVIFTSGSTGFPKGVMIDHTGALNTCLDINERFAVNEKDTVLALSALYFDLSVYDIFGMLAAGGTIVYPDHTKLKDPQHWIDLIHKHHITVWNSVPELANMLIEYNTLITKEPLDQLKLVMMSGDWIPVVLPAKIKGAAQKAKVVSLGGATETSIWSIFYEIDKVNADWKSIPYGKALKNQTMHVLNDKLEPCPVHTIGDIYIGGIGVAKGYLKDEEKTKNQFIISPVTNQVIYKTGDIGRVMRNGNIEFLGREDFQVKVQGYRIELGEIEAVLVRSKDIKAAAVDVKTDKSGTQYLAGYIVREKENLTEAEIKEYAALHLQSYMIPKVLVFLDELPVTINGKINRKELPEPRSKAKNKPSNESQISASQVLKLKNIWKEILDVEEIANDDDFFELGGNSILAIRLVAKIETEFKVKIGISQLLVNSKLEELLKHMLLNVSSLENQQGRAIVPINTKGNQPAIFLVHPIGGSVFCYNNLSAKLGKDQPLYAFQSIGMETADQPLNDVVEMAKKYIAEMKTIQSEGPYKLGGWSFGGIIAFEMAQQLEAIGDEVEDLYLIDSYFHSQGYDFEFASDTTLFEHFLKDLAYQAGKQSDIRKTSMPQMLEEALSSGLFPEGIEINTIQKILHVFRHNCIAYRSYKPAKKVSCLTSQFIAKDATYIGSEQEAKKWMEWVAGELIPVEISGNHFTIFSDKEIGQIVMKLKYNTMLLNN